MKGESAPELGCCHKTQPLGSTGSSLSSGLDFQLFQGNQVRRDPSPIFEDSLLTKGEDIRMKWGGRGKSEGIRFPLAPGPEHSYPAWYIIEMCPGGARDPLPCPRGQTFPVGREKG